MGSAVSAENTGSAGSAGSATGVEAERVPRVSGERGRARREPDVSGPRFLVELFHHRWAVPILAELASDGGGRVAELTTGLDASRGGVRQALGALVDLGLVGRNMGHGHPLRPEYVLTESGRAVAIGAERIVEFARAWTIERHAFRKWPLPVVYGLGEDGARFSELRDRMPGVTDRALSIALRTLGTTRLAERIVRPSRPPGVLYLPTDRAEAILPSLRRLARAA